MEIPQQVISSDQTAEFTRIFHFGALLTSLPLYHSIYQQFTLIILNLNRESTLDSDLRFELTHRFHFRHLVSHQTDTMSQTSSLKSLVPLVIFLAVANSSQVPSLK